MPKPRVVPVDGYIVNLFDDLDARVELDSARWVDGHRAFLAEWSEAGSAWSMRLTSTDGVSYVGAYTSPDFEDPTPVAMTRWVTPRDDGWLLEGTLLGEDGPYPWKITLFPLDEPAE